MKRTLVLGALCGLSAIACQRPPAGDAWAKAEVLAIDDARFNARAKGDIDTMSRIYADDYVLITAEGDVRSKADQINEMKSAQLKFSPPQILERTIRVYGQTAVVNTHEHPSIIRNGQEIGGEFQMVRVYVRSGENWRLVSTQATRIVSSEGK